MITKKKLNSSKKTTKKAAEKKTAKSKQATKPNILMVKKTTALLNASEPTDLKTQQKKAPPKLPLPSDPTDL